VPFHPGALDELLGRVINLTPSRPRTEWMYIDCRLKTVLIEPAAEKSHISLVDCESAI